MNDYLMYGVEGPAHSADTITLLDRAAAQLAERPLPPFADGIISMLALSIMGIIATSPDDEAERIAAIASIMRRK